jgi:plasmid maintenance system antidote protein VapI
LMMGECMTLSETIRETIRRDGRSTYALANDSGVSRPQVVRFINGTRELTLPVADKLCRTLGLELRPVRRTRKSG